MAQSQLSLVDVARSIKTLVISRQADFDTLFDGFTQMRAISYVSSADLLLEFLDQGRFDEIELLVGENISTSQLKEELAGKDRAITEKLAEKVALGSLRILVPRRTVHTKLYLLQNSERNRVIVTSANLTQTARSGTRQINYAMFFDASRDDPLLKQVEEDYRTHTEKADLFMGDLVELLERKRDLPREEVISVWLGGQGDGSGVRAEVKAVVEELISEAFAHPAETEQPVIHLSLPVSPDARRETQKLIAPLGVDPKASSANVSPGAVVRYVEENHGVPLMRADVAKQELWLGFRGKIVRLDTPLGTSQEIDDALANLEAYVETVDLGQCPDPTFAKMSVFEALLYVMASPLANEHMRERRKMYGLVDRRGPSFLYIYGPAQNGKTTFLRYCLMLVTGTLIESLPANQLTKRRIRGIQMLGTSFPLMFDDVSTTTSRTFEDIVKSHWETSWTDETDCPQLIFTSNNLNLKEWAKSRMKRVDFDVHFVATTETRERLARILEKPNPIFGWFAHGYLAQMQGNNWLGDDELGTARRVMKGLYDLAGRGLPDYFPVRPLEQVYDPDLRIWGDLMKRRKVTISRERESTVIQFSDDLESYEVREYQAALPQTVKCRRRGKTLIVENPAQFHHWLGDERSRNWWKRLALRR